MRLSTIACGHPAGDERHCVLRLAAGAATGQNRARMEAGVEGEALKDAVRQLAAELEAKMAGPQQGVGTFCDHALLGFIAQLEQIDASRPWEEGLSHLSDSVQSLRLAFQRVQLLLARRAQGRFVEYEDRRRSVPAGLHGPSDLGYFDTVMSQGAFDCLRWKGLPLFKTAYDAAIYPMLLWDLKPRTILELGSGCGASATWLVDLAAAFGLSPAVYSVDLKAPPLSDGRITFLEGDLNAVEAVLPEPLLRRATHPWLVVEDAHVNVEGVLRHVHPHLAAGDYLVVEDSAGKQNDIRRFLATVPGCYKVDAYYTDFFGRNVTCAQDSILVRMVHP
jgi:cephalosporin hydroxylase